MTKKLIHPLWTHLPAIGVFIALIIRIIAAAPYPAETALHFGTDNLPDRYGSPWELFGILIGLPVLYICLSVFLDELWARQEKKKTFNWLSLFDDLTVGWMAAVAFGHLDYINSGAVSFSFPWSWLAVTGGITILLAIILEILRPYRIYQEQLTAEGDAGLKREVIERINSNSPFIYWDSQNPGYLTLLTVLLPVVMVVWGIVTWTEAVWVSVMLIIVGLLLIIPNGGQRVLVTRQGVTLRWGIIGIRVLKLTIEDIEEVSLHEFSPLRDFGGYGIRFGKGMKAYYLRGTRGVKIETVGGKKYLIGSDRPENLLSVIQAVKEGA